MPTFFALPARTRLQPTWEQRPPNPRPLFPTWEQKYNTLLETYRKASVGRELRCAVQVRENIKKEYSSLKKENCKYQQIIENIQKWQKTHAEHFNYKIGLELSLIIKKK